MEGKACMYIQDVYSKEAKKNATVELESSSLVLISYGELL